MSEKHSQTRRDYLKVAGVAGTAGLTGLSGCIQSLTGGGGPIPVGSIIPITGALSAYGQGMQKAADLAVTHVNDAGGPLGRELSLSKKDSETKPSKAVQKYNSLVNEDNIVGFVGAASSGVSVSIAENVASDQVMQVSHASTSPVLAEIGFPSGSDSPKYFGRTAPNDGQQGIVMGQIMNEDKYIGADKAAFLYVDNAYGEGLAKKAKSAFGGETTDMVGYSKKTQDYSSTLDKVFAGDPDAVGFVGYPENGRTILQQWSDGGYGGEWVLSEGVNSKEFFQDLKEIVAGMYVTSPNPESGAGADAFESAIGEANTLFAAHAYDALFLQALAMERAGEASGTAIAENIRAVSRGEGETTVTVNEFQKAKDAISNDESINYQGASSPVDLNQSLEPLNPFAIIQVQDDGSRKTLETIPRDFFKGKL
jgi:ABC-type branched-subunit amino acid transport system substrate-binding protein